MAIIRISRRSKGKILRVHGTSNLLKSKPVKKITTENDKKIFYKQLIRLGKNSNELKNYKKSSKKLRKGQYKISETSIIKVLKAYQKTIQGVTKSTSKMVRIEALLLKNLKSEKVHPTVIKNIIKYESITLSEDPVNKFPDKKLTTSKTSAKSLKGKKRDSIQNNSKQDAYKTIHNYLVINPNRKISAEMELFWISRISEAERLYNLQRIYQLASNDPNDDFEKAIKKYISEFSSEEIEYLSSLWNLNQLTLIKNVRKFL